jgi:hypothetical protein
MHHIVVLHRLSHAEHPIHDVFRKTAKRATLLALNTQWALHKRLFSKPQQAFKCVMG